MGGMLVGKRAKTFKYGLSTAADHFPNSLFKMYDAPYFHTHAPTHNTHARTKIQHARTDKDPLHTHARTRNTCASARTEVHACNAHRPNMDPHTCFWS